MGERDHGVHHGQREDRIHAVLDDVLLAPSCEENDQRSERKNGKKFNQHIAGLGGARRTEGVEFPHVVVGADVHGERNGRHEHSRHAGHAAPLLSHQFAEAFALSKFILDVCEALRDLASLIDLSIAHGGANPLFHISVAFFRRKNTRGKEPWRRDGRSPTWWRR